jgi:hypothetical protein
MTALASLRRRIQKLTPYFSLLLLAVPVLLVEPFKFVAVFVAGKGHWFTATGMIIGAYAVSLERFPLDMGHYAYPACRK